MLTLVELKGEVVDLRQHMGVFHEDAGLDAALRQHAETPDRSRS